MDGGGSGGAVVPWVRMSAKHDGGRAATAANQSAAITTGTTDAGALSRQRRGGLHYGMFVEMLETTIYKLILYKNIFLSNHIQARISQKIAS